MFDAVDHVVTRHLIDPQARQVGINRDVALAGAGITVAVSDAGGYGQVAVADGG